MRVPCRRSVAHCYLCDVREQVKVAIPHSSNSTLISELVVYSALEIRSHLQVCPLSGRLCLTYVGLPLILSCLSVMIVALVRVH